jgi:hypothetical protein
MNATCMNATCMNASYMHECYMHECMQCSNCILFLNIDMYVLYIRYCLIDFILYLSQASLLSDCVHADPVTMID